MFLFLKLFLAHLIADFVLQFEELYRLKVRSLWGHILHVLCHGIVSLLLLFPYLNEPILWGFIVGLVLMHLTQDFIKYTLTQKIPKNTFVYFMADQFVHVLVLAVILLFPLSHEVRGFPHHPILDAVYRDNNFTLLMIFFLSLTFAASYTFHAFCRSFVKTAPPLYGITSFEMTYALIERSVIGLIILSVPNPFWGVLVTPLIGLARLPVKRMRDRNGFLVSLLYAVVLSLCFRPLFR